MTVTKSATGKLFQRVPVPLYLENFQHSHRTIWLYAGRLHCFTAVIVVCALWDLPEPPTHTPFPPPPRAATFTHAWEKTHTSPRTTVNHLQGTNKKNDVHWSAARNVCSHSGRTNSRRERGGRRVRWSNHCPLTPQKEDMQYREQCEEAFSVLIGPLIFLFCPIRFIIFNICAQDEWTQ